MNVKASTASAVFIAFGLFFIVVIFSMSYPYFSKTRDHKAVANSRAAIDNENAFIRDQQKKIQTLSSSTQDNQADKEAWSELASKLEQSEIGLINQAQATNTTDVGVIELIDHEQHESITHVNRHRLLNDALEHYITPTEKERVFFDNFHDVDSLSEFSLVNAMCNEDGCLLSVVVNDAMHKDLLMSELITFLSKNNSQTSVGLLSIEKGIARLKIQSH